MKKATPPVGDVALIVIEPDTTCPLVGTVIGGPMLETSKVTDEERAWLHDEYATLPQL